VTFLFSDIEGSTRLLHELGPVAYAEALAEHRLVMREAFKAAGGVEVDIQGDAFFVAFADATGALAAAEEAQRRLAEGPIRVRMGIHTGEPLLTDEGYVGIDVHQGARVMSAGHGGQVLVSGATRALVRGDGLVELGLHRLKDLTEPQPLYQLGAGEFPPLKTLYQTNLPVQPTPLLGREAELAEVLGLLRDARLVTLTGAGGSGKTRLGLQAAAELVEEFPQGVWWVSLAALRDPVLVEPTIAQAVGARDALAEHLRDHEALLLLDNLEHLLDASPAIAALLSEAPRVRLLATSRERLGIAAEQEYPVPTLDRAVAVALFTARARRLKPGFEPDTTVSEICGRLDGLPLAVELAAARIKVLTPARILERLGRSLDLLTTGVRDAPDRQRTLRATIDWSYALLSAGEGRLFGRLGVFPGSFDFGAAEAVCAAELDTLSALVDKSLLRETEHGRFFMLEAIHEYAFERLEQSGEISERRGLHLDYFRALAEEAQPALSGRRHADWLARLEDEHDNLRAALGWAVDQAMSESALRIASALGDFWRSHGDLHEGRQWLERALATGGATPAELRIRAHKASASIALWENDPGASLRHAERALALTREIGDLPGVADSLIGVGNGVWWYAGDRARARELFEESLTLHDELGDKRGLSRAAKQLGELERDEGRYKRGAELLELSIAVAREDENSWLEALATHSLADLHLDRGDLETAERLYARALDMLNARGDERAVAYCLAGLACVAASRRQHRPAAKLWGAVEAIEGRLEVQLIAAERARYEPFALEAVERWPQAAEEGQLLPLEQVVQEALGAVH
jgi:predicted ATPase